MNLFGCADKRQAREPGNPGRCGLGETGRRVNAGAHRRTAQRQTVNSVQRGINTLDIVGKHPCIAGPFLAERQRRRILHMSPADLDNIFPLPGLLRYRIVQSLHCRDQPLLHVDRRCNAHGGGKRVVGRLRHIHMIVGVNRRLASKRRARELAAAIGNHFVYVHVELGAAAGHPHVQRKHVMMPARKDLVTDFNDQLVWLLGEPLAVAVGEGGGFLQDRVGGDHFAGNQIRADTEMFKRALRLCAPKPVGGNINFAEAVSFFSSACHYGFLQMCSQMLEAAL